VYYEIFVSVSPTYFNLYREDTLVNYLLREKNNQIHIILIKTCFYYLFPLYIYRNRISFTLYYFPILATPYSWPVIIRDLVKPLSLYSYRRSNVVIRAALLLKLINLPLSSTNTNSSSCYCKLVGLYHALLFLLKLTNLLLSSTETVSSNRKPSPIFLYTLQLFGHNGLLFLKLPDYRFELLCSYGLLLCHLN
jgi:hypothetical protein